MWRGEEVKISVDCLRRGVTFVCTNQSCSEFRLGGVQRKTEVAAVEGKPDMLNWCDPIGACRS